MAAALVSRGVSVCATRGAPREEFDRQLRCTLETHPDFGIDDGADQTRLPFERVVLDLRSVEDVARGIVEMRTHGSAAIACSAAYGMLLAAIVSGGEASAVQEAARRLRSSGEGLLMEKAASGRSGPVARTNLLAARHVLSCAP